MDPHKHEKIKLVEINSYLTCYLCKGYLIDATTISECLHSFCRSCIIKFLQENCYCPVCEVIINKAKPCLKLDKTLQDIVYKLVPGLFVKEMYRRKEFYQNRPALAPKVSPEERGEDTERTIFNPQDAISLSIEYISDDSAPGAIPSLQQKTGTAEEVHDNPMKRYLQCPGMCRIEVLKKFVRNKYNVDTNLFHIDVLYKRVPLPDHYTLIDIGYIYSWKRNEPMKFFFRITDINKVTERFDYFDGRTSPEIVPKPTKVKHERTRYERKASHKEEEKNSVSKCEKKAVKNEVKSETAEAKVRSEVQNKRSEDEKLSVKSAADESFSTRSSVFDFTEDEKEHSVLRVRPDKGVKADKGIKNVRSFSRIDNKTVVNKVQIKHVKPEVEKKIKSAKEVVEKKLKSVKDEVLLKPEITEEIKNKIQSEKGDVKNSVYTNITLNRADNVEIITKIQKVSNKEGQPIGLNIINHTVKKTNKVQNNNKVVNDAKVVPSSSSSETKKTEEEKTDKEKEEIEKSNFLKNIELTAKSSLPNNKKEVKPTLPTVSTPSVPSTAQKRKNSSPMKNDKTHSEKKPKIDKKPMKIIIQPKKAATDIQALIDNCKIPSSLSITLNEGDNGARTPPLIPPVKNYIEILKIPDKPQLSEKSNAVKDKNKNIPTFQKIFEESIIKKPPETTETSKPTPLDLTNTNESNPKRKILDIALQLQKKTKIEQEDKIAIPRLATQRTLKPPSKHETTQKPQTSATLHSPTLGLNYTVSVGHNKPNGSLKKSSKSASKTKNNNYGPSAKNLSSSQLLEKYNIQNLAQLTASFNFNPNYGALQHAMFNHHSWLNQGPLLQYEKYLQNLSAQSKIMGNIKEN